MSTERDLSQLRPWIGEPPLLAPPELPGYRLHAHERFDFVRGSLLGLVLIPLWSFAFVGFIALLGGRDHYGASFSLTNVPLGIIIGLLLVPVLHEIAHGLAALLLGARPSFGIGPGLAYTTFRKPMGRAA